MKPYLFEDPARIMSASWTDFESACREYEVASDTAALAVLGVYLDAAMLSPLVSALKAQWEMGGSLSEALRQLPATGLSKADTMRLQIARSRYA